MASRRSNRWLYTSLAIGLSCLSARDVAARADSATGSSLQGPSADAAPEPALARALAHIKTLPAAGGPQPLAVHVTPTGHWRFANAKGEVMTAAGLQEARRVVDILAPSRAPGAQTGSAPGLVLTVEAATVASLDPGQLPAASSLSLLADSRAYALQRQATQSGKDALVAQLRANLLLEVREPAAVREAIWQLERPLAADTVRLLSFESGGPRTLTALARREPGSRAPLPDAVDPYGLVKALPALRGQKVLVVGRVDNDLLWYQPRSGTEQSILVQDLRMAASASDIALVILDTRLARQPGERTWAFLKVGVPGFDEAIRGKTVADFYSALGSAHGKLILRVLEAPATRTHIEALPMKTAWGRVAGERGVGGVLQDVVSGLTGNLSAVAVRMELRSRERQEELDRRWLPGIPSRLQIGYAILLAVGFAGWPVARRWWARIWPAEKRAEYRSAAGYGAAVGLRGAIFAGVFVPLVAVVAFPVHVIAGLRDTCATSIRVWRASRSGGGKASGGVVAKPAAGPQAPIP